MEGEYSRIRVCLDITKPLLRRKRLNLGLAKPVRARFTYERLPDVCFCCGRLSHNHQDYTLWESMKETCKREGYPYGNWLKAAPRGGSSDFAARPRTTGQRHEEKSSGKHQGSTPTRKDRPQTDHPPKEDTRAFPFPEDNLG